MGNSNDSIAKTSLMAKFNVIIFLFIFVFSVNGEAQKTPRKNINIPDILGYKTLKGDFHMHTVFSDGTVWPSFRVEEAWTDGLDIIAITDHLGHHPKNKVDADNFNRNYDVAKPVADKLGIVLIKGSEITTKTNYGHLNAIFLKDINLIDKPNPLDEIKAAKEQGAFITWNHPGRKQEGDLPVWREEQENILKTGLLNGIEIVNKDYYYPLAFTWSNEKKLTQMSCSDIHEPSSAEFDCIKNEHRPMTLVFSKDTSLAEIKDALLNRRTVAYYRNILMGQEEYLKAIFNTSVKVMNPEFSIDADSENNYSNYIRIKNNSSIDFEIELADADKILKLTKSITLAANTITILDIKPAPKDIKGDKEYVLKYKVKNLMKAPDEGVIVEFPIKIKFI